MPMINNKTKIAIGFIFLLFDYNFTIKNMTFGAFPTFIGFLLLYMGLKDVAEKSRYLYIMKKVTFFMIPAYAFIYAFNMFGILNRLYSHMASIHPDNPTHIANTTNLFLIIQLIINTALILGVVYTTYLFACGCRELANKKKSAYASYGRQLFNTFQIYAVLMALYIVVYALQIFNNSTILGAMEVFSMCATVASVVFVYQANRIYNIVF